MVEFWRGLINLCPARDQENAMFIPRERKGGHPERRGLMIQSSDDIAKATLTKSPEARCVAARVKTAISSVPFKDVDKFHLCNLRAPFGYLAWEFAA